MIDRIQLILKSKNLSPSQFADEIQVQRSGISHILSGRNKPSLDFVMKILSTYQEINADWLIFGKGQMVKQEPVNVEPEKPELFEREKEVNEEIKPPVASHADHQKQFTDKDGTIDKIVVFYNNGTFREYIPG